MEVPGTQNICQAKLQAMSKASLREIVWAVTSKVLGLGLPIPSEFTSHHHVPQRSGTEQQDLMFSLLSFGPALV